MLVLAALTVAQSAAGQGTDAAIAESLFLEGRRLLDEGEIETACAKFQASQDLDPQLGTLLNLGNCLEKAGRSASAWAAFTELSRLAARAGQHKRAEFANERVAALEPTLSYLTLAVQAPVPGEKVTVDGRVIADGAYGTPLPLDPGERSIVAEADGFETWSGVVTIEPGMRQSLSIPTLLRVIAPPPLPPSPLPPPPSLPAPPPPPEVPREDHAGLWTASVVAYAIGGAGLVWGGVTGILALNAGADLTCPNGACPPSEANGLERATALANVSNVAFVIGGLGVVTGVVTMLLALDDDAKPALTATPDGFMWRF